MVTTHDEKTNRTDEGFKFFIHKNYVLSRILKDNLDELKGMSLKEIDGCLNLGEDGKTVIGRETEYVDIDGKRVVLDTVFDVRIPGSEEEISVIVGVEGQNDPEPGYPLSKRAEYYLARMVSAQKGVDFMGKDYSHLRKTYSIWCVLDPRSKYRNTVIRYRMRSEVVYGGGEVEPKELDTFNIIVVNLGEYCEGLPDSLAIGNTLFSRMSADIRTILLKDKFKITLDDDELGRLNELSDTYQDKYDHGFREGRAEGEMSRLIRDVTSVVSEFDIPIEKAMSILGVPEDQRELVTEEASRILNSDS